MALAGAPRIAKCEQKVWRRMWTPDRTSASRAARRTWPRTMFCVMGGAGVQGGRVIGSTEARGERPKDRPLVPGDIHSTLFQILGVNRDLMLTDRTGRPVAAIAEGSTIPELF